jgi:ABC-type antimicrobial peptide transport system permease subunit
MECKVKNIFSETGGKFGQSDLKTMTVLDISSLLSMIKQALNVTLIEGNYTVTNLHEIFDFISSSNVEEYIDFVIFTFPSPRIETYNNADYQDLLSHVIKEITEIVSKLGYHPVSVTMPILEILQEFNLAILFMSLIFLMVLSLFVVISVILIYSLLMVSVQRKSTDIGITRLIGQNKKGIIVEVILETFVFVIPGFLLAVSTSFIVLRYLYYYEFEVRFNLKLDSNPTWTALIRASVLGIIIPLISAIIPIREALSQNIIDALDYGKSKTKAVIMKIIDPNTQNAGIYILFGIISTIYGIAVYILLPQSLLSLNFGLILQIFFLILIGFLLGLILIAVNFQFIIEIFVAKLLFF